MPSSVAITVADAVTTALAEATLSLTPDIVERSYGDWELPLERDCGLRIDVMTNEHGIKLSTQSTLEYRVPVLICVRRKLGQESQNVDDGRVENGAVDALTYLVQEIAELFVMQTLAEFPYAVWQESKVLAAPVAKHLHDARQFTGIAQIVFKADRDIA